MTEEPLSYARNLIKYQGMDSTVAIPVLIIVILALLFVSAIFLNHLVYRYMLETSPALKGLTNLNAAYAEDLAGSAKQVYSVHIKCKSKPQFDGKTIEHAFDVYMQEHYATYKSISSRYKQAITLYTYYETEYKEIASRRLRKPQSGNSTFRQGAFYWLEAKIYQKQKIPAPSLRINVLRTYTSPKKRNHYSDNTSFYPASFLKIMDNIAEIEERRKKANEEREKLTPALRYQILVRDRFTCAICGRTQKDGVVLQIDHILPVSKGGKTVPENLRVLCSLCNYGKGDTFDPNGLN